MLFDSAILMLFKKMYVQLGVKNREICVYPPQKKCSTILVLSLFFVV